MRNSKLIVNILEEKSRKGEGKQKRKEKKLTRVAVIALYISVPTPAERSCLSNGLS